jgi:hypothetical protein
MTSIYSADNPYFVSGPSIPVPYKYQRGSVMDFIYNESPIYALFLQTIGRDREFDEAGLNITCFVPENLYSDNWFDYLKGAASSFYFCEKAVFNSCIRGQVSRDNLRTEENIPNLMDGFVRVSCCGEDVFVNGLRVLHSAQCSNGVVHVIEGLIQINEEFVSG